MEELLKANGWPDNLNNNQIINLLPSLWKKLEREGLLTDLVNKGFDYQHFVNSALNARAKYEAMEKMFMFFKGVR